MGWKLLAFATACLLVLPAAGSSQPQQNAKFKKLKGQRVRSHFRFDNEPGKKSRYQKWGEVLRVHTYTGQAKLQQVMATALTVTGCNGSSFDTRGVDIKFEDDGQEQKMLPYDWIVEVADIQSGTRVVVVTGKKKGKHGTTLKYFKNPHKWGVVMDDGTRFKCSTSSLRKIQESDKAKPADEPKDDEAKPVEAKPADEPKDDEAKPADEPKDDEAKPADEVKPADVVKPGSASVSSCHYEDLVLAGGFKAGETIFCLRKNAPVHVGMKGVVKGPYTNDPEYLSVEFATNSGLWEMKTHPTDINYEDPPAVVVKEENASGSAWGEDINSYFQECMKRHIKKRSITLENEQEFITTCMEMIKCKYPKKQLDKETSQTFWQKSTDWFNKELNREAAGWSVGMPVYFCGMFHSDIAYGEEGTVIRARQHANHKGDIVCEFANGQWGFDPSTELSKIPPNHAGEEIAYRIKVTPPRPIAGSATEETMTSSERVLHRRRLTHGVQTPVVLETLMEDIEEAKRNWTSLRG